MGRKQRARVGNSGEARVTENTEQSQETGEGRVRKGVLQTGGKIA